MAFTADHRTRSPPPPELQNGWKNPIVRSYLENLFFDLTIEMYTKILTAKRVIKIDTKRTIDSLNSNDIRTKTIFYYL